MAYWFSGTTGISVPLNVNFNRELGVALPQCPAVTNILLLIMNAVQDPPSDIRPWRMSDEGKRWSLVPHIENGVTTPTALSLPSSTLNFPSLLSLSLSSLLHSPPTNMCETMTRDEDEDDVEVVALSLLCCTSLTETEFPPKMALYPLLAYFSASPVKICVVTGPASSLPALRSTSLSFFARRVADRSSCMYDALGYDITTLFFVRGDGADDEVVLLLPFTRPESYEYGTSVSQIGAPTCCWVAPPADVTATTDATTTSSSRLVTMMLDMVHRPSCRVWCIKGRMHLLVVVFVKLLVPPPSHFRIIRRGAQHSNSENSRMAHSCLLRSIIIFYPYVLVFGGVGRLLCVAASTR